MVMDKNEAWETFGKKVDKLLVWDPSYQDSTVMSYNFFFFFFLTGC